MCAYSVRVNGGDVSGYVDDRGHGQDAKLRSAIEHKNLTNVSVRLCCMGMSGSPFG